MLAVPSPYAKEHVESHFGGVPEEALAVCLGEESRPEGVVASRRLPGG
jgi:hypothetical protein